MNDSYRAYYTKNNNITAYMVNKIAPSPSDLVLEPCGGDGMFIDALLAVTPEITIDTCDINLRAVNIMKSKYSESKNISIRRADTLTDSKFDSYSFCGHYDKIIGNPPYGGWQEHERRAELKKKYSGFYVKETYSLFLLRCLSMLKERGILSFIVPDTFLFLHNHKQLRSYILQNTEITEIVIFPSKFFPGVSFGYSNLCIITLIKSSNLLKNKSNIFKVIQGLKTDDDLLQIDSKHQLFNITVLTQNDVMCSPDYAFLITSSSISDKLKSCETKLSDVADCVTGIYCGDNKKFLGIERSNKKHINGYPIIAEEEIAYHHTDNHSVDSSKRYIPLVKGSSSTRYFRTADQWVILWTEEALKHYCTDKKARFQNSKYYFKKGIALPMVKSSKIRATLINDCVFDQSVVGIFLKDDRLTKYTLAYLNSQIANEFIHTINPTANNSANYLKKIPFHIPNQDELLLINNYVDGIISSKNEDLHKTDIDQFFRDRLI